MAQNTTASRSMEEHGWLRGNYFHERKERDGCCYRTGDSVNKVIAFCQKHPEVTPVGSDETGVCF